MRLVINETHTQSEPDPRQTGEILRARRWLEAPSSGNAPTIAELAKAEDASASDVSLKISLAFLAPDIVEAIIDGLGANPKPDRLAQFNLLKFDLAREAVAKGLAADPKNPDLVLMDANLIAKSGRKDEGLARFEEAKRLLAARQAVLAQRSVAEGDELGVPKVGVGQIVDPRSLPPWEPVSSTVVPP